MASLLIALHQPLPRVIQSETFAIEINRTLVGSIALVLAVPLTTIIGVIVVRAGTRTATTAIRSP